MDEVVRISVRNLVEFILRCGDIEPGGGITDPSVMQLGAAAHRRIQKSAGGSYRAEVSLSGIFDCETLQIKVEGRADGVITGEDGMVTIDEIKGLMRSIAGLEEPVPVHLAQAKCYAYLYAREYGKDRIGVRMTYTGLETDERKYFHYDFTFRELEDWFTDVLKAYQKWAEFARSHREVRQNSIGEMSFPFTWREGQLELAGHVYRTIVHGKVLMIQAPTGVGKTLSTLFPALKAMGSGRGERIFYLTARTIARTVAMEAMQQLTGTGLRANYLVLTAKEKICRCEEVRCEPAYCPYAKGHYDRINDAMFSLLSQETVFDRETIEEAADRYMVCPFELSLDLSEWVDVVIGDYNYVFHPRSKLKRFFGEGVKGDNIFLVDEAHNLVDRGRDMYSAQLCKEDLLETKKKVKEISPSLARGLDRVNRLFLARKRECETYMIRESTGDLPGALMNLYGAMSDFLDETAPDKFRREKEFPQIREIRENVMDLYFAVGTFLDTCERLDEHYIQYDEIRADGRFYVDLLCVNPSRNLRECFDKARSSILFSATLLPAEYYTGLLCEELNPFRVYAKSVFDPARCRVLVGTDTSARYTRRGPKEYEKIAVYICRMVQAKPGNYMVFFPSYRMLEDVGGILAQLPAAKPSGSEARQSDADGTHDEVQPAFRILTQRGGMSENEREEFLTAFSHSDTGESLVGLCVMGSVFAEGIDLKGDHLIGAIVVGPGLPMISTRQEILRKYYDDRGKDGFYYAYQCPGMNRVLQAAGRVIRTQEDAGCILLLDDRFALTPYASMFPREWAGYTCCRLDTFEAEIVSFWEQIDQKSCKSTGDTID